MDAYPTVPELLRRAAKRWPDATALAARDPSGGWRRTRYGELAEAVELLALGLAGSGVARGDRVAILAPNSPEWQIADQAVLHLGAVTVPLYLSVPAADQAFILADSGATTLLVADASMWERLEPLRKDLPGLRLVAVLGAGRAGLPGLPDLTSRGRALRETDPGRADALRDAVRPDDVATLVYTSGTTGRPKGVVLTHANITFQVAGVSGIVPLGPGDATVSFLPLSHGLQRAAEVCFLAHGVAIHYARALDTLLDDFRDARPTILLGVPRVWEKAYRAALARAEAASPAKRRVFQAALRAGHAVTAARDAGRRPRLGDAVVAALARRLVFRPLRDRLGGRVRFLVSGGAPLSADVQRFFDAAGIPILQGYGLTEAGPVLTIDTPEERRTGTVGKPMRGVEVRLAEDGEILGRSPGVARGYWHRPEETAETFGADGWLRTGDVGRFDERGFLLVTDRKKEILVKSNGKKVAPAPIEKLLEGQPEIQQAVLLGDGRSYCAALLAPSPEAFPGRPLATLAGDPAVVAAVDAAVARVNAGLARHEQVRRFALLPRELTVDGGDLTPTLKVKRRVVAERFAGEIEALYAGPAPTE